MNGKDIFMGLKYVGEDLIEEAETIRFPASSSGAHRRISKPLLIAAIITLMVFLMGCAVAYVLHMEEIKIGEQQVSYDSFAYDPDTGMPVEYLGQETVNQVVLSFAGMQKTPAFQAAQEWYDFTQSYDPDGKILDSVWGSEPEFPAEYVSYGVYTQEMKEELDRLLEKYDLKLKGAAVPFRSHKQLLRAMGRDSFLKGEAKMRIHQAQYYENGNLDLIFFADIPGGEGIEAVINTFCCLYYRQKDCLISDYAAIGADGDQREWNYRTASGNDVLIVRGESSYVWVFCDTGACTVTLRLEPDLTDRQAELAADAVDFSPSLLIKDYDDGAVGSGEEIDGYRISLKSAKTDGHSVYVVLSVTAPEGVDMERKTVGAASLLLENEKPSGLNWGLNKIDDGDGLANTCDLLFQRSYTTRDGSAAISRDTVMNVYFEDIYEQYRDNGKHETLVSPGVWNFDVTFEDSDFREIELLREPITAKASIGWNLDGTDAFEELKVTSVKLRSLSIEVVSENQNADFFGASSCAVMKDGTRVEIMNREFVEPIDLDQVDYILLADGTKLPVPEQ